MTPSRLKYTVKVHILFHTKNYVTHFLSSLALILTLPPLYAPFNSWILTIAILLVKPWRGKPIKIGRRLLGGLFETLV